MIFSSPPNAPLTMNRMCLVLMVLGAFRPRWVKSIIAWIWPAMSFGERAGTSVSSISFSRFVCTPRPLTSRPVELPAGGDLVDLVNVDDAVLGARHVAVRQPHQVAHHVLDVAAHVAGLGELRGVGLDERHANQVRRAANQEGLAHARRPDEDDVLLGVIRRLLPFERQPDMVIVIAQRHAQHLLGLVLLDDKPVEVFLHLARFVVELELVGLRLAVRALRRRRRFGVRRLVARARSAYAGA